MAKEAANPPDQSMEEILQSIKRIIAEENQEDAEAAVPSKKAVNSNGASAASGDVLELTDIAEDGELDIPQEGPTMEAPPLPQPTIASSGASATRAESILEAVEREPAQEVHKDVLSDIDSLLSSEAAQASAKALKSLHSAPKSATPAPKPVNPGMPFRSGHTVEDLALEALRPMLKEWLDSNLPGIVERLVEREVKKLSGV